MRLALGLSYDGAAFHGWQTQPHGRTVQDTVEAALADFLDHPVEVVCAGRTDTGVHALDQVIHLDTPAQRSVESWLRGVNTLLPPSVAVQWVMPVPEQFHARFSARARTYVYIVRNTRLRSPLLMARVGWVYRPLDLEAMRSAARQLVGEHDFSAFRSAQCQAASPVRTLHALRITQRPPFFVFEFHANAFLHHMIRNLMGALIYIGLGRQPPEWAGRLLVQRDRRLSAPTFSAEGLYFAGVDYPDDMQLPRASAHEKMRALTGLDIGVMEPMAGSAGIY